MKMECPKDGCDYSSYYLSVPRARTGMKVHISKTHSKNRAELYKKVDEILHCYEVIKERGL